MADQRDAEVGYEQRAVGLDVDRDQDDERPEREEVREPGHRPLAAACAGRTPRRTGLGAARPSCSLPVVGRLPRRDQSCRASRRGGRRRPARATVIASPMTSLTTTAFLPGLAPRVVGRGPMRSSVDRRLPAGDGGIVPADQAATYSPVTASALETRNPSRCVAPTCARRYASLDRSRSGPPAPRRSPVRPVDRCPCPRLCRAGDPLCSPWSAWSTRPAMPEQTRSGVRSARGGRDAAASGRQRHEEEPS